MRKKRVRKFLNVFLCVISIVAVFSVTAMAAFHHVAGAVYTDGDIFIDLSEYDDLPGVYYLSVRPNEVRLSNVVDGDIITTIESYQVDTIDYLFDKKSGEFLYFPEGDDPNLVFFANESDVFYDLVPCRSQISFDGVGTAVESVFDTLSDFATLVSENALLLLFAIGLPVCSFSVGLLIRLKERT